MKKADNFNASKWLVENKITFQSRLNEEEYSSERINQRDIEIAGGEVINHTFDTIDMIDLDNGYKVKVLSTYYFRDPGVKGYSDTNSEENPMISGVKTTLIDPSGKPIKNHNFTGSGQWWMLTSGKKYFMPQIKAWWEDKIGRLGLSESKLNEDLTDEIAALPDFNSAMDSEKSELIVGKYAVVRYDESDEGGENMYVVWDNTVNQDEIGSYDDVPEFESEDPAEVAAFLKKNESLNEVDMQNMSSAYPQYDRFEFRKFKDNLEMKVYENYPLTGNIKSQLPKNLIQVSPDNIETDWAKIDYTIIKGNNNMTVRLDYPMYIHLYYDTKDIKDLYEKTADEAGFKYKESPNQGVITLLFSK